MTTTPVILETIQTMIDRAPLVERTEWMRRTIEVLELAANHIQHLEQHPARPAACNPPEIAHALNLADTIRHTQPNSMSDTLDWINDARLALGTAADMIETIAVDRDMHRDRAHNADTILDHLFPQLEQALHHLANCDQDPHPYPDILWLAGGCKACETLGLIRHHFDQTPPMLTEREIENVLTRNQYL